MHRFCVFLVAFVLSIRIGEATNPGPEDTWTLGVINPTGLAGKGLQCDHLTSGIYGVSESHLTSPGVTRFRQELRSNKSSFSYHPGHPAPFKQGGIGCIGGKNTGVGFLSAVPTRILDCEWDESWFVTSRVQAASFFVGSTWIQGGIAYGYASQVDTTDIRTLTNDLLCELSRHIKPEQHGLKFIGGDFNQQPNMLPAIRHLEDLGWLDIQDLAHRRWNLQPSHTCKHCTRKDYLLLSPALQELVLEVHNQYDMFPDHSILMTKLKMPSQNPVAFSWFKPKPMHQLKQQVLPEHVEFESPEAISDPSDFYSQIWKSHEKSADKQLRAEGLPGLSVSQIGRATIMERKQIDRFVSPVKPPRRGEPTTVECRSLQHKRWFVQLRRLLNYQRIAFTTCQSHSSREHQVSLWHSILRAPGFGKSFQHWWPNRAIRHPEAPILIPSRPPNGCESKQIYLNFEAEFRHWEAILRKTRNQAIANRYEQDVNAIFRDIQKPAKVPVEVLVAKQNCSVLAIVDPKRVQITSPPPPGENILVHLANTKQWVGISPLALDIVVFQEPHGLQIGDIMAFSDHIGEVRQIHKAFEKSWSERWDKHKNVDPNHWEEIQRFIELAIPRHQMRHQPLNLRSWQKIIKQKRNRAASGLDGVSKIDLQLMNNSLQVELIRIFDHAEATGIWPNQMMEGAVFNLAKVDKAEGVNDFRPITILPLPYRCWASYRAKSILKFLEDKVPTGLKGNMPGQSSVAIWWQLQSRIEDAQYNQEHITGCVTDLIKAFNLLPRDPIFAVATRLGIDPGIIRAWKGAIGGIRRRFFVRMQPSQGVLSSTGFPEGDPLSVTAMALANIVVHSLIENRHPQIELQTYVDNIELLGQDAVSVTNAFESLQDFCSLLDIEVDINKTYMWSTNSHDRKELGQTDHKVEYSARDLGGHMQYSAYKTNATVRTKCEKVAELWPKLNRSPAPKEQKVRALAAVAWAGALHGCATVHLNCHTYDKLRSGAIKSIFKERAGANSHIQLALIEKTKSDPEFYSLWSTVLAFRRYAIPDLASRTLAFAHRWATRKRKPGPSGVLIERFEKIGWRYIGNVTFEDVHRVPIDILESPIQEVKFRVERAWQQHVGSLYCKRKGFEGLQLVDVPASRVDPAQFSRDAKGALVILQNGTFCTNDFLEKMHEGENDSCKFCQAPDSLEHRHWHCPATQQSRCQLDWDIRVLGPGLPPCTRDRGWMIEPQEVRRFKESLYQIPSTVFEPQNLPASYANVDTIDLFTDGTAVSPQQPMSRLAAWGAILAPTTPEGEGHAMASGGVPGYWQTVGRAELTAFLAAIHIATINQKNCRIWCDNQNVVDIARQLQLCEIRVHNCMPDHDLWNHVADLFRQNNHDIRIIKVGSHQDSTNAPEWQSWAFRFNDMADNLAASAIQGLPGLVIARQQEASRAIQNMQRVKQHLHEHFARVALKSVANPNPKKETTSHRIVPHDTEVLDFSRIAEIAYTSAPNNFRFAGWMVCIQWMKGLSSSDSTTPVTYLSWYEFLWLFQLKTGKRGIHSVSRHNNWALDDERLEYDAIRNAHQLSKWITHIVQLVIPTWKPIKARPSNSLFQNWMMCVAVRLREDPRELLTKWMQETRRGSHFHRIQNDIGSMPVATQSDTPSLVPHYVGLHRFGFGGRPH